MGTRNKLMIAILVVLLSLAEGNAIADGPILDFTGGITASAIVDLTLGWEFTVTSTITINALGLWDQDANGLSEAHQLGLWTNSDTLLASATITTANSTPVASASSEGDWRFTPVSPLTLAPGDYVVGAFYTFFSDFSGDQFKEDTNPPSTIAGVTYDHGRSSPGVFGFPAFGPFFADPGTFGPNVGFLPAAVPEPTTVLLLGSGLLGLAGYGRKKFFKK